ncbi:MAG: sulfurtransferase TusA family protein [Planctomycetota bacterium]
MATVRLDTLGLKCPQPVLKIAATAPKMKPGDVLEIIGDCPTFAEDIKKWCDKLQKILISCVEQNGKFTAQIQF